MLALPRHFSRMLSDIIDDDMHYWPLDTLRQSRHDWDLFRRDVAWPSTRNNTFNLDMDVRQFEPNEISVKLDDDMLEISGKHEKKRDDGRYEFCEFRQKCTVPKNVMVDQLRCKMDKNGYLKVEAPLKEPERAINDKERNIPIEMVNRPSILKK